MKGVWELKVRGVEWRRPESRPFDSSPTIKELAGHLQFNVPGKGQDVEGHLVWAKIFT
jgi:hypothetical protein